jgi:hypothetical protein
VKHALGEGLKCVSCLSLTTFLWDDGIFHDEPNPNNPYSEILVVHNDAIGTALNLHPIYIAEGKPE